MRPPLPSAGQRPVSAQKSCTSLARALIDRNGMKKRWVVEKGQKLPPTLLISQNCSGPDESYIQQTAIFLLNALVCQV